MNIEILQDFNRTYKGKYPFLTKLNEQWAKDKPLKGLKILHNIPITRETLIKLESLYLAGAEILVTHINIPGLEPKQDCLEVLTAAGANVELSHNNIFNQFDFALDCCAQVIDMPNVTVTRGYTELTQFGSERYRKLKLNAPVISIDDSYTKCLEGMYGTGEAFVRLVQQEIVTDLKNKKFVLFGYGKVGRGVAKYLAKAGAKVSVVEISPKYLDDAKNHKLTPINANIDNTEIIKLINTSDMVVMATGVTGLLSNIITSEKDINNNIVLLNMGASDEFGNKIAPQRVFANKAPVNFLLESPTRIEYIDPIFYAHNYCIEYLLKNNQLSGYNPLPKHLDEDLINQWSEFFNVDCSDIYF
ncbi:NAD-binding protein [Allofrancisella guangzhouensis]|uniref:S-adenosyl-L-homocysteine hydrolase NAD binding domain-containing protein n=1 Tax=Allofrancisella guangzhouensis TaxID=594679 RepID=A0A0A8E4X4_9GAMM|nr:NAD-binding protein [Allofrancisella guangzhouensis]AJC49290.1 hypothetical protein SD28_06440 [Allofrancisella guangzhouensis]MBK2027187.1 NAD-binding protein [Allofrancisella guangzhouensis]MBK2044623.1 NAD-binding protein [Allofrancisella guangzhouensis]MBK2045094.1 NAD-binding protein [Allofrancisella guangzhouensis]